MNRKDLADIVSKETGLPEKSARAVVEAVLDGIVRGAQERGCVTLSNFGTFSIRTRAARTARNIGTGELVRVPEVPVFHFRPSAQVQRALRRGDAATSRKRSPGADQ